MEQQSDNTAGTATAWVIAGTVVFRTNWSWAGPSCKRQIALEPPVRNGQYALFADDELRAALPSASQAPKDQATVSAGCEDDEPAHEDLCDPAVAKFIAFSFEDLHVLTTEKGCVKIVNGYVPISPYDILTNIYSALIGLCRERNGEKIAEGVWRVDVGYKTLASAAGCSKRSIPDAIKELAAHGYVLRYPEKQGGGHSSQYYVRDEAGMMAIFRASRVKFARKKGEGHIELFRGADEVKDETIARN